jgi:hypothetical protein
MSGRLIYEDRGARISIMARVNAQGPDTLQQTGSRPTRKNPLADRGRAIHSERTGALRHPDRSAPRLGL